MRLGVLDEAVFAGEASIRRLLSSSAVFAGEVLGLEVFFVFFCSEVSGVKRDSNRR